MPRSWRCNGATKVARGPRTSRLALLTPLDSLGDIWKLRGRPGQTVDQIRNLKPVGGKGTERGTCAQDGRVIEARMEMTERKHRRAVCSYVPRKRDACFYLCRGRWKVVIAHASEAIVAPR